MRAEYPRSSDELFEHWRQEQCFCTILNLEGEIAAFIDAVPEPWQDTLWVFNLVTFQDSFYLYLLNLKEKIILLDFLKRVLAPFLFVEGVWLTVHLGE